MKTLVIVLVVTNLIIFLVSAILFLGWKYFMRLFKTKVHYRYFGYSAFALCAVWNLMALYGFGFGRFSYETNEIEYVDSRVPEAFDGYRIVHISDFHLGGFIGHEAFVDTLVSVINSHKPDLICFTGDMVSYSHQEAIPFIYTLRSLRARDGVFAVLGNHDYGVYDTQFQSDVERDADRAKLITLMNDSIDWRLLQNENYFIRHGQDSLCILGLENQAYGLRQKVRKGNMRETMMGSGEGFRILLSHDPSQWDAEVLNKTDIPLTLSGHTHAMQFMLFGWTPGEWFFKRSNGMYKVDDQCVYVNIGLGGLLPFRIGATPEITLITLRRNNAS